MLFLDTCINDIEFNKRCFVKNFFNYVQCTFLNNEELHDDPYFLLQGVFEEMSSKICRGDFGIDCAVDGTIPPSSGITISMIGLWCGVFNFCWEKCKIFESVDYWNNVKMLKVQPTKA